MDVAIVAVPPAPPPLKNDNSTSSLSTSSSSSSASSHHNSSYHSTSSTSLSIYKEQQSSPYSLIRTLPRRQRHSIGSVQRITLASATAHADHSEPVFAVTSSGEVAPMSAAVAVTPHDTSSSSNLSSNNQSMNSSARRADLRMGPQERS